MRTFKVKGITMRPLISRFWRDERGTLLLTEWVFLTTILVIAVVPLMRIPRSHPGDSHLKDARSTTSELVNSE